MIRTGLPTTFEKMVTDLKVAHFMGHPISCLAAFTAVALEYRKHQTPRENQKPMISYYYKTVGRRARTGVEDFADPSRLDLYR